jgi:hypothetical protein
MKTQWIIMTTIPGDMPEDFVGPFDSKEEAERWAGENTMYLNAISESAVDNSDCTGASCVPEVYFMAMNDPAQVEVWRDSQDDDA